MTIDDVMGLRSTFSHILLTTICVALGKLSILRRTIGGIMVH